MISGRAFSGEFDNQSVVSAATENLRRVQSQQKFGGFTRNESQLQVVERRHRKIFDDQQIMEFWVPPLHEYKAETSVSERSNISSKESLDLSFQEEFEPPPAEQQQRLPILRRQSTIDKIMRPEGKWTTMVLCLTIATVFAYVAYLLIK